MFVAFQSNFDLSQAKYNELGYNMQIKPEIICHFGLEKCEIGVYYANMQFACSFSVRYR